MWLAMAHADTLPADTMPSPPPTSLIRPPSPVRAPRLPSGLGPYEAILDGTTSGARSF